MRTTREYTERVYGAISKLRGTDYYARLKVDATDEEFKSVCKEFGVNPSKISNVISYQPEFNKY